MRFFKWGYLLLLHLFIVIVLAKSDFLPKLSYYAGINSTPEITKHYTRMMMYHERMDSSIPTGSVIFIGDSITQGLATSAISQLSVNYGIGSDTTLGVIERLDTYHSINTAKAVVIAIGINDIKRRND